MIGIVGPIQAEVMRWRDGRPVRPGGDARRSTFAIGGADMDAGIIDVRSRYSVPDTLARLQSILKDKGITVFALIDHSGEAEKVGLKMRPTQLLIFGSPKGGTPLMVAAPRLAIDLPLKALAWQDEQGKVWLSYNSPEYLQQRHGFPADLLKNIAGIPALIQKAVE
jgi:uncharacterized protein (DUF302 family)